MVIGGERCHDVHPLRFKEACGRLCAACALDPGSPLCLFRIGYYVVRGSVLCGSVCLCGGVGVVAIAATLYSRAVIARFAYKLDNGCNMDM